MFAFFLYAGLIIGLSVTHLLPTVARQGFGPTFAAHLILWSVCTWLYWRWSAYRIGILTEELKPLIERLKGLPPASAPEETPAEKLFDLLDVLGNIVTGDLAGLAQFGLEKILASLHGTAKTDEQRELEQRIAGLLQAIDEQRSRLRVVALLMGTVSAVNMLMTLT